MLTACNNDKGIPTTSITTSPFDTFPNNDDGDDDDDDDGSNTVADTGSVTGGPQPTTTEDVLTSEPPVTSEPSDTSEPTSEPTSETTPETTEDPTSEPGYCGDNVVDAGEQCDTFELAGTSCSDLGFAGGSLYCGFDCQFDTSSCTAPAACGDGVIDQGEACDCGGNSCTSDELNYTVCTDLLSPKNTPYTGGTLGCSASCQFVKTNCTYCGDNKISGSEECDGTALGGLTCTTLGYTGGTLKCKTSCTYDTASCTNEDGASCGDGICSNGETSCTCASDCPDNPATCSACECGNMSASCYCDSACTAQGDCCPNYQAVCG